MSSIVISKPITASIVICIMRAVANTVELAYPPDSILFILNCINIYQGNNE